MIPLTTFLDHDTLVFRSYDLTGTFPRTSDHPDDPIQDRGCYKSPPLTKDSSSNPVVLTSYLMTKVPTELLCIRTWSILDWFSLTNLLHLLLVPSSLITSLINITTSLPHLDGVLLNPNQVVHDPNIIVLDHTFTDRSLPGLAML